MFKVHRSEDANLQRVTDMNLVILVTVPDRPDVLLRKKSKSLYKGKSRFRVKFWSLSLRCFFLYFPSLFLARRADLFSGPTYC